MAVLAEIVSMHDVLDVEAFVQASINRGRRYLTPGEREDLVLEGLAVAAKANRDYVAQMDGYAQPGRFSGYLAWIMPKKLEDAYHRLHESHRLVANPDTGKREWQHGDRAVSLDAMLAEDPDRGALMAAPASETDLACRLGVALDEHWLRQREIIVRVGELLGSGATPADVASMEGLSPDIVRESVQAIMRVAHRLESEDS